MNDGKRKIWWYNVRLIVTPSFLIGCLLYVLIPIFFSLQNLQGIELYLISEQIFIMPSIFLLGGILNIESDNNIEEITSQSTIRGKWIVLIRYSAVAIVISLGILGLMVYAYLQGGEFEFVKAFASCFISSLFVGTLTLLITVFVKNLSVSFLITFSYYIMEYTTKGKYTKKFYLFSLLSKQETDKVFLIILSIVFLILIIRYKDPSSVSRPSKIKNLQNILFKMKTPL